MEVPNGMKFDIVSKLLEHQNQTVAGTAEKINFIDSEHIVEITDLLPPDIFIYRDNNGKLFLNYRIVYFYIVHFNINY